MDYLSIIHTHFKDIPAAYGMYLIHVTLVTKKALSVGARLGCGANTLRFIEEAAMLHDIGCCRVHFPEFQIYESLPYLCHMTEGYTILTQEGFPLHARVASTHTGVGITAREVKEHNLPLKEQDYVPETLEERIISYADLFYSKSPKTLFVEKTPKQIRSGLEKFGQEKVHIFDSWHGEFSDTY